MWISYVLLSVFLTNFICRSVSAQQVVFDIGANDAILSSTIRSKLIAQQTSFLRVGSKELRDKQDTHSVRKRASSVTTSSQRSPLSEVMLRILDTIQLMPKKRSRRVAVKLPKWKSLSLERQTLLNSVDPDKVK